MSDIAKQLQEHLENGADWEAMDTPILGVRVVRVPATKTRGALLHLEINPIKDGKQIKRKGLFVGSKEMLVQFSELLGDDKTYQLAGELEKINPDYSKSAKKLEM